MSGLHDFAAERVLQPLYRAYRLTRPRWRPDMLEFSAGLRFRTESAHWSHDRRREWMLQRLRSAVRRAARETGFYRERFTSAGFDPEADFGFDDFGRLPVLERAEVRAAGHHLRSGTVPRPQLRKDATGGSTGAPTEIWTGPEERGWRESGREHFMRRIGLPTGRRVALLWGHHLDPVARETTRERIHDWMSNARWFDCLHVSPEILERYHRELEQWRPECIVAYASTLTLLAEHLLRRGIRPGYPTRCSVTGAEKLLSHQRQAIESAFGRPVYERYGGRDVGLMGFQLAPGVNLDYEIDWANVLVEPETVDAHSAILVTKLHADAMPMVRYRVGDLGRFPTGSRAGHPAFVLHEVIGRETDRLWLPDGGWVHGLGFPHLMKDYPVREYQVVQKADYSVSIRVVPAADFNDESRTAILRAIAAYLRGVSLDLALVAEIPRTRSNKWRPVISEAAEPARIPREA